MSLSGLHAHLLANVTPRSGRVRSSAGSSVMQSWYRGDEVHAQAVVYLRRAFAGRSIDANRLALAACQDLVALRVMNLSDSGGYRTFRKRSDCLLYIHRRARPVNARTTSGLRWS